MKSFVKKVSGIILLVFCLSVMCVPAFAAYCPNNAHTWGPDELISEATCTARAKYKTTCTTCGKTTTRYVGSALGHDYENYEVTKEPTCTATGKETGTCVRCGKTASRTIKATGHQYGDYEATVEPTCKSTGKGVATCQACGKTVSKTLPKSDHKWSAPNKYGVKTCEYCGKTEGGVHCTAHSFGSWEVITPKTCVANGKKARTCKKCGYTETATDKATGHSMKIDSKKSKNATCMEDGLEVTYCTVCKLTNEKVIKCPGYHKFGNYVVTKKATCKKEGEKTATCTVCKAKYKEKIPVNSKAHVMQKIKVVKPTPKAGGYTLMKCKECGKEEETDIKLPKDKVDTTSIKSISAGNNEATITLSKKIPYADQYQVQYSTKKDFGTIYSSTIKENKTTFTIKNADKLKSGKTYYFRVRVGVEINGKMKWSAWTPNKVGKNVSFKSAKIK